MVWRGEVSRGTRATGPGLTLSEPVRMDHRDTEGPLLMMTWAQRAARKHPSRQMCRELYWSSSDSLILHMCWACCTVALDNRENRSQEPVARSQKPGARSQEPGARSQEPGARSQEPGARSTGVSSICCWPLQCFSPAWLIHHLPAAALSDRLLHHLMVEPVKDELVKAPRLINTCYWLDFYPRTQHSEYGLYKLNFPYLVIFYFLL